MNDQTTISGDRDSGTGIRNGLSSCAASTPRRRSIFDVHLIADNYATHKHAKVRA